MGRVADGDEDDDADDDGFFRDHAYAVSAHDETVGVAEKTIIQVQ